MTPEPHPPPQASSSRLGYAPHMDRQRYLRRIGYAGPLEPGVETLRALHRQHLLRVPFENLDIHRGRPIVLRPQALFDKVVVRRRGGFCYELNGLFAWLLRDLGFEVDLLAARHLRADGRLGPAFDHMALGVRRGRQQWLTDVGYGDSFTQPQRLDREVPSFEGETGYRVVRRDGTYHALERRKPGRPWAVQYLFDTLPRRIEEFAERCRFHQTSSESHFTRKRLCSLATPEGRITLSELRLIESSPGSRRETELPGEAEWHQALAEHFGVKLKDGRSERSDHDEDTL